MERNLIPLIQLIVALGWVLAYLVGIVIAVILLTRRRSAGRWVLVVAFSVGLAASICNRIGFRALVNSELESVARMGQFGLTALNPQGGCCGALVILAIALAIWLLAHEKPAEGAEEPAEDEATATEIPHTTKPVSGADGGE
jgi:hypothetical protein